LKEDEIIEMAEQVGMIRRTDEFHSEFCDGVYKDELVAFANLVALRYKKKIADLENIICQRHWDVLQEREKTLQLWMLLDDVDTADDIAKSDDDVYRSLCRQAHAKRWAVLTNDEVDAAIRARGQE